MGFDAMRTGVHTSRTTPLTNAAPDMFSGRLWDRISAARDPELTSRLADFDPDKDLWDKLGSKAKRQSLCVCFVDVVGFSALMHADEEGAFLRWTKLREEVVIPLLVHFGGNLIKSTGDGIFATFKDPVVGARWGHELQIKARQRRQSMALRVSLNYCQVLRDGHDLLGHGVNVAARLQEFAVAGGVILTQAVYDKIAGHVEFEIRSMGSLTLRKMDNTVTAYELVSDGRYLLDVPLAGRQLPTIAVMPLANLSSDESDEYLASGIVEDIVQQLSRQGDLTVISRSSTLAFARQEIDPRSVGKVLGVRYLITGTLRRKGGRIRMATELLDTDQGEVLASLKRDFDEHDMFSIQDELVETTLIHLLPGVRAAERRRMLRKWPSSLTAYDSYLKALDMIGSLERDLFEQAFIHLENAIQSDPGFSAPLAWAARWYTLKIGQGWSDNPQRDAHMAADLAKRAIRFDEQNALALATYGHVQSYLFGDFETAIEYLDRAREANPSSSISWLLSSVTLASVGRNQEAVTAAERALRLSPFDQRLFAYYVFLGTVHYDAGHFKRAIKWISRGLVENPRYTSGLRTLAVAHVAAGQREKARSTMARLIKLEPGFSLSEYRNAHCHYNDPLQAELFYARLKEAGAPD